MKYLFIVFSLLVFFLSQNATTLAEQTKLKVRILPIDCLYEVIDVGTQQLHFLTPDTCPIDIIPPLDIPSEDPPQTISPIAIGRSNFYQKYIDEGETIPSQNVNQQQVASAKEKRDILDSIKLTKDIETFVAVGLAVSFLAISSWWFVTRKGTR